MTKSKKAELILQMEKSIRNHYKGKLLFQYKREKYKKEEIEFLKKCLSFLYMNSFNDGFNKAEKEFNNKSFLFRLKYLIKGKI